MTRGRVTNDVQTAFRLPQELYDRLVEAAGDQPIGGEIRRRLEASLFGGPAGLEDPRFRDVIAAIGQAASVAAKTSAPDGYDAYAAFEVAVPLLLEVFRPEGSSPAEDWEGIGIASAALSSVAATDKIGPLMDIVRRRHGGTP